MRQAQLVHRTGQPPASPHNPHARPQLPCLFFFYFKFGPVLSKGTRRGQTYKTTVLLEYPWVVTRGGFMQLRCRQVVPALACLVSAVAAGAVAPIVRELRVESDPTRCAVDGSMCSLHDAADWITANPVPVATRVCLAEGTHRLSSPLVLSKSHAHTTWTGCNASGTSPVISGGVPITGWTRDSDATDLWSAPIPAGIEFIRQMWANGVRANRTEVNASTALGCLGVLQHGYITQHPVFWNDTQAGGTVELVYFQQMTPWQAQRCVVTEAKGSIVSVAQPCFEMISQFVKNECFHGHTHNVTRDLASGLPYTLENLPLPGLSSGDRKDGQFWFSKERHQLWYRPHESELSPDGKQMTAAVVVPVSEGLVMATGAHDVLFEGVDFEYSAWNQASTGEGFIDLQDGVHLRPVNGNASVTAAHNILGAIDCVNCTAVSLSKCTLSRMGGTAVSFGGVSKGNSVSASHISDTSCAGVNIDGYYSSDPAFPDAWRSTNNSVTGTVVAFTAREYTGCVGIQAGWVGLAFALYRTYQTHPRCLLLRTVSFKTCSPPQLQPRPADRAQHDLHHHVRRGLGRMRRRPCGIRQRQQRGLQPHRGVDARHAGLRGGLHDRRAAGELCAPQLHAAPGADGPGGTMGQSELRQRGTVPGRRRCRRRRGSLQCR